MQKFQGIDAFFILQSFVKNLPCASASKNAVNSPLYDNFLTLDSCTAMETHDNSRIGRFLLPLTRNFCTAIYIEVHL